MNNKEQEQSQSKPFSPIKGYLVATEIEKTFPNLKRWKFLTPLFLLVMIGFFPAWIWFIRSQAVSSEILAFALMSLGIYFPVFSIIYGYFWVTFWQQRKGDSYSPVCSKCGKEWPGEVGQFYYGEQTGESTSKYRGSNTITTYVRTTYEILGTEILDICDICAKAHRLENLRNEAYQVFAGFLTPSIIAIVLMFLNPDQLQNSVPWLFNTILILLILSMVGGIIAILVGFEGTLMVAYYAIMRKDDSLDYYRDRIAIALRQKELGNQHIYWIREFYKKMFPGRF